MAKTYPFRKDDGSIIQVDWATMMDAENSVITLEDGTTASRARDLEDLHVPKPDVVRERTDSISDALGFTKDVLADHQEHLRKTGIKGIEFKEDPQVPGFIQVHCTTQETKLKYAATRGFYDKNSLNGGGAMIGEAELRSAKEIIIREYGE